MPGAKGLFHRAIIESGAVLRLTTLDDAIHATDLLLAELGLVKGQVRELQNVPMARLLAANAAVNVKLAAREPGQTPAGVGSSHRRSVGFAYTPAPVRNPCPRSTTA